MELLELSWTPRAERLKVTCGSFTREFTGVDRFRASVLAGFALWCDDNKDLTRLVLHDEDIDGVSERMIRYATNFVTSSCVFSIEEVCPVEVGCLYVRITDVYFSMFIDMCKVLFEISDGDTDILCREYVKMCLNNANASKAPSEI